MKRYFALFMISIFLFISCNKEDSNPTETENTVPQPPTHISPADISSDVVSPTTFSWNASSGAFFYMLQVSEVNDFSTLVYDNNVGNVTTKQVHLNKGQKYYWRIAAANNIGQSEYSTVWSFTTGFLPGTPNLISPKNDTSFYSMVALLKWDTTSNAVSYSLQVSTDFNFNSFIFNDSGLTATSKEITGLSNSNKYYWRVRANNLHGISNWSSTWNFTIEGIPNIPTLLSPTDGASDQDLTIDLKWNASHKAYSYTLQVSKNSSFSEFVYNQIGITDTKRTISGLDDSTTYYWRVSATNSYGTSDYSSVWSFSTYIIEAPAPCPGVPTVTYEGKTYNTVKIKNQCWLKENLNVGTKINGSNIQTNDSTIEKYCYNDYEQHCNLYGGLYQWEEALQYNIAPGSKGICPAGWHIPTLAEFETLRAAVHNNGNSLKELGEGTGNGKGTNSSGFSVLLAGLRYSSGGFNSLRMFTVFWSSTASVSGGAYNLFLDFESNGIDLSDEDKAYGFSVRCLKNN